MAEREEESEAEDELEEEEKNEDPVAIVLDIFVVDWNAKTSPLTAFSVIALSPTTSILSAKPIGVIITVINRNQSIGQSITEAFKRAQPGANAQYHFVCNCHIPAPTNKMHTRANSRTTHL